MNLENNAPLNPDNISTLTSDGFQPDEGLKKIQGRYSPGVILLITIVGIAVAEIIAMIVVYYERHLPYPQQVLIDATVMTVIIFPILYYLSFRPILRHIEHRRQFEQVLQSRLRIVQYATTHTLEEVLRFTLDELEILTSSKVSYFHFVEEDQKTIDFQAWSTSTSQDYCAVGPDDSRHYSLEDAGVWADCIRLGKVVVHNDYASLPYKRGLPQGHAPVLREMAVPIMRDEKIVAVLGVGNKPEHYTAKDVEVVSTLADFSWDIVRRKQVVNTLRENEERLRTLTDWTYDWELWLAPDGKMIYNSPSCSRITGYNPEEFIASPQLLIDIVHPDDRDFYYQHHQLIHDEEAGLEKIEYRVIAHNGDEHWVEHICRPVFADDKRYLGRRISNRDVTQRKQAEKEVEERNEKEKILTQTIHTMQLDVARDLHDTLGQNIGFLRMKLDYLSGKKGITKADMVSELQSMTKAANESYDLIRGTLAVLQSNDSSDLFRIFSRYAEQIEERSTINVEFYNDGSPKFLSPKRMRQLFYIFREALTNIEKHAQANHVSIQIEWENDCLVLAVSDDGTGFDTLKTQYGSHYGLRFMRERAELLNGTMNLQSAPGSGTNLVVRVPYE